MYVPFIAFAIAICILAFGLTKQRLDLLAALLVRASWGSHHHTAYAVP